MQPLKSLQPVGKGPGWPFLLQYLIAYLLWLLRIAVHPVNSVFPVAARHRFRTPMFLFDSQFRRPMVISNGFFDFLWVSSLFGILWVSSLFFAFCEFYGCLRFLLFGISWVSSLFFAFWNFMGVFAFGWLFFFRFSFRFSFAFAFFYIC
jgi:hypothetical protein